MGYYIQCTGAKNKAQQIIETLGAIEITQDEAGFFVKEGEDCAVICVVDNGPFEAAAYCYNPTEFRQFTRAEDPRPKKWLLVENKTKVEELCGYQR